jgi:hypothetical protein
MSSVSRGPAQVLTKRITLNAAYTYPVAALLTALEAGTDVQSGNIYLCTTAAKLETLAAALVAAASASTVSCSAKDIGKDIFVGLQGGESQLLHFRLVNLENGSLAQAGGGKQRYVVVENMASTEGPDLDDVKLGVNVSRV